MDELIAAQQLLGRKLGKARAGEDRELSGRLRDAGETVAHMLCSALRVARVHSADNKALDLPAAEMVRGLGVLSGLVGPVHLVTVDDQAFVNDVMLRTEGKPALRELGAELHKHNVGGITFHAPLDDRQARALAAALGAQPKEPMPRTAVRERLVAGGLTTIELHGVYRFRMSGERVLTSTHALGAEVARADETSTSRSAIYAQPGSGSSRSALRAPPSSASTGPAGPTAEATSPSGLHAPAGARASSGSGYYAPAGAPPTTAGSSAGTGARPGSSDSGLRRPTWPVSSGSGLFAPTGGAPRSSESGIHTLDGAPTSAPSGYYAHQGGKEVPTSDYVGAPLSEELALDAADAAFEPVELVGAVLEGEGPDDAVPEEPAAAAANPAFALLEHLGTLTAGAWSALATGRTFNPLPLRRSVAELLEIGADSTALWDAWATGPTRVNHAVSVTLHALVVGQAAGLSPAVLQDLGVAALVHDIGYAGLLGTPKAVGAEGLARHPGEGARLLLRQRGFSDAKVRRLRALLDHHRPWSSAERPSVLGAILRLVEDYLGFLRVMAEKTTRVHVLGAMAQDPGALYHPVLLQLLVNALGQFPPGVLLGLEDGRTVRSVTPVRTPEAFATPLVREVDPETHAAIGPQRTLSAKVNAVYPG